MRRITLSLSAAVLTTGLMAMSPAVADDGSGAREQAVSMIARLSGDQEVPTQGGPAVGDRDGGAVALVKVKGDRVTFALSWNGIDRPTLGHIHQGAAGFNGEVKVGLFTTPMPNTVQSAAGQTSVTDAALAKRLRTDPTGFYVNLHTKEFPGGAVRGQLRPLAKPVNPLSIIRGGKLRALADGGQEVPTGDPKKVGDPDGHSVTFLYPGPGRVGYSLAWVNLAPPLAGHVHQGTLGRNGEVKIPLFATAVPENIFAISGTVSVPDASLIERIKKNPTGWYSNLHTKEFPDGAVRGQLFR
ncbi:CHRD domain-containing protein [Streptomyces sp. NBS 14/10]|uniref:CHRD domain-containing protein n=1 Tax=Streptomyces sp. NBS 14/10 TaxID=1945643 RepID=UPI000B7DB256|nr:CHRD domain-containing protein [Streptomyces sp. NBS 14/10]KAK1177405.1 CHRD domain-containing protein [Streptomyces sp. NBS 14/10]NUS81696.1 CHRD domain-containing protein [Streptomyces sp.]